MVPPPMALPQESAESTLVADQASLQDGVAEATGNVRLERNGQALEAPFVRYNRESGRAQARDGMQYYRPGIYLTADNGDVQINDETGNFNAATYSIITNGGRGKAGTVTALGGGAYELTDADYTTCEGETKAWLLSADRIELDRESGRGEAFNSVMRFYGVPVFYTPYLNFPIDDKRHTGVLPPTFGSSSDSGFELAVPYYINIAPNYDATIVPRVLADRGLQLGGQFRYLHEHHRGEFDGEYLPSDNEYGDDRALFHFEHIGQLNEYVGVEANYTQVSDDEYFDDLSNDLASTSTSQLERAVRLTLADTGVRFTVLAQDFQTLDDLQDEDDDNFDRAFSNDPYRRLPQARLEMLSPSSPFRAGLNAEFTNFQRDDDIDATRSEVQPRLLWGVDQGGWYANSEASYRLTRYSLRGFDDAQNFTRADVGDDDVITRGIPQFNAETGLRFARTFNDGWVQTLEPRMQYLYTGYEDQSDIPVFDSGVADLHFDRLFSDNRFVGSDRIGDANQLTLGVSSRFIEPDSGRTVAKLDLGRVTGFRDLRVNLPNSGEVGYGDRGSDYVAGLELRPTDNISARTTVQYDPDDSRVNRAIASASYKTDGGYQLDLAYRRYRDYRPQREITVVGDTRQAQVVPGEYESLEQTAVGLRAPVTANLDVLGRWNYSLERSQNVETLAGFEYRPSCCWAGRVAWRRYVADDDGSFDTAIMFQFVLNGLGQFGDTVQSFVDDDVYDEDDRGRSSSSSFDTIRFP
ncbi:Organic solvent tolerance protein [Salinisphaera dokdonensis CL-ES53]|uniref:LPS-assembly protein LptD n=1 Tax=Salinisphaera dokdonensis CL-ES53 TaxID=1304272 RepID=A0ABV2AXZ1_9GAMM